MTLTLHLSRGTMRTKENSDDIPSGNELYSLNAEVTQHYMKEKSEKKNNNNKELKRVKILFTFDQYVLQEYQYS